MKILGRVGLNCQGQLKVDFNCRVNFTYRRKFSWLYVRKKDKKRCVSRVRKCKKLNNAQLFTLMQAVHTSLLMYVKPAKFKPVRK